LKTKKDLHLLRKFWHMLTGVCALTLTYQMQWSGKEAGIVAGMIGLFVLGIELIRLRSKAVNTYFLKVAGPFIRTTELTTVSALPYYAIGVSCSFLLYSWGIAVLSILYLIFADPIAALVGTLFKTKKITTNKSIGGSLAFVCVCLCINFIYRNFETSTLLQNSFFFFLSPICGALSEFIVIKDDNLSIPIIAGGLMTLLSFTL